MAVCEGVCGMHGTGGAGAQVGLGAFGWAKWARVGKRLRVGLSGQGWGKDEKGEEMEPCPAFCRP
eukprot:209692-Chlamydomonas_euryale.AAC.2